MAKTKPSRPKPGKRLKLFSLPVFILLFLFSIGVSSISAYRILDYDTFIYVNKTGDNLTAYGWQNYTYGSARDLLGVYVFPTEEVTVCGAFHKSWNQLSASELSSYNMTVNGSINGVPLNFSIRYRVRNNRNTDPFGNLSTYTLAVPSTIQSAAGVIPNPFPLARYYGNLSGLPKLFVYKNLSKPAIYSEAFLNFDYQSIQVDYFMTQFPPPLSAGYKQPISYNVWVNGIMVVNNQTAEMVTSGSGLGQRFNGTYFLGTPSSECYIYDDVMTIVYDPGETPISPLVNMTIANDLPEFQVYTTDKYGALTSTVRSTSDCTPVYSFTTGQNMSNPDCNPISFYAKNVIDSESDPIESALSCNGASMLYSNDFSDESDSETIKDLLLCNESLFRFYDPSTRGYVFNTTSGCPTTEISSVFSDDRYNPNRLYSDNQFSYMISFDFMLKGSNYYTIYLYDSNSVRIIKAAFRKTANDTISFYIDSVLAETFNGFDTDRIANMRLVLDTSTNKLSIGIIEGSDMLFSSEPISIDWSFPISEMVVSTLSDSGYAGNNEIFGSYRIDYMSFPAFSEYVPDIPLNCTQINYGDYTARYFMTDSVHPDNRLNYVDYDYHIKVFDANQNLIDGSTPTAFDEGFDEIFMGSQTLKYLFAFITFVVVVIGVFVAGMKYGAGGTSVILAMFAGSVTIIFMVILGILPLWFLVVIIGILALAGAVYLRTIYTGSGNSGGG